MIQNTEEVKKTKTRNYNLIKTRIQPFILLFPSLLVLAFLAFYPLLYNLILSVYNWSLSKGFEDLIWFKKYISLFTSFEFWNSLKITVLFTIITVTIELILGFGIALMLNYKFLKYKKIFRSLFMIPMILSPVIVGSLWRMMYDPKYGVINYIFHDVLKLMPDIVWLGKGTTAFIAIMIADIWYTTPLMILILLAGLESLPDQPFESAKIDGANNIQLFTKITLPLMKPFIAIALLLRIIDAIRVFDLPWIMTMGGPGTSNQTMSILTYLKGFKYLKINDAAALAIVFIIIIALISSYFIHSVVKNTR
jgi:multiple sugar transport system permease protein